MSADFEDIVFVLENRRLIWKEMKAAPQSVYVYLQAEFAGWLNNKYIEEWISAHTTGRSASTAYILEAIKNLIDTKRF